MRGMILAAGRGQRMRDLTLRTPKALIDVAGKLLIEYSIDALIKNNIHDIVINICYFREQIKAAIGDGSRYGANIHYSEEEEALETGGGIVNALPLLGDDPFLVMSCDIITDFSLQNLPQQLSGLAHLVLVDNPAFHPQGDFSLLEQQVFLSSRATLTFANIGVYRPELFSNCKPEKFPLGPLLKNAAANGQVTGQHYKGRWHNVGTPEDLNHVLTNHSFF